MLKPFYFFLLLILPIFCQCTGDDTPVQGMVFLRITNDSMSVFDEILVNSGDGAHTYGALQPGQSSDYQMYEYIHSYSYIKVTIDDQECSLTPTDYVGEKQYRRGHYTYRLSLVNPDPPYALTLDFEKDSGL